MATVTRLTVLIALLNMFICYTYQSVFEARFVEELDFFLEDKDSRYKIMYFYKTTQEDVNPLAEDENGNTWLDEVGNSAQIMRIDIEIPELAKFSKKYNINSTPRVIVFDGEKVSIEENVEPTTPDKIKKMISKKRFNYLPDDAYLDIEPTDVKEQSKTNEVAKPAIAKPEPPKDVPKVEPSSQPPVSAVVQPLYPQKIIKPVQSFECETAADDAKKSAERSKKAAEESSEALRDLRKEFEEYKTSVELTESANKLKRQKEKHEKAIKDQKKYMELWSKVHDALEATERIKKDVDKTLSNLRDAVRHIDFTMDEWYNDYAYYKDIEQRKLEREKNEGYRYRTAQENAEKEYKKKIDGLKKEIEKAKNDTQKRIEEEELKSRTHVLSVKTIEVGEPYVKDIEVTEVPIHKTYTNATTGRQYGQKLIVDKNNKVESLNNTRLSNITHSIIKSPIGSNFTYVNFTYHNKSVPLPQGEVHQKSHFSHPLPVYSSSVHPSSIHPVQGHNISTHQLPLHNGTIHPVSVHSPQPHSPPIQPPHHIPSPPIHPAHSVPLQPVVSRTSPVHSSPPLHSANLHSSPAVPSRPPTSSALFPPVHQQSPAIPHPASSPKATPSGAKVASNKFN